MAVLVIADHDGAGIGEATNKVVTAARAISDEVDVLVMGLNIEAVCENAARISGVRSVLRAESAGLSHGLAEAIESTVVPLAKDYEAILVCANAEGKNFAPRVAAKLDVSPITDIVAVIDSDTFVRPIHAGSALETVRTSDARKVVTVRASAFNAAGFGDPIPVRTVTGAETTGSVFISEEVVKSARPDLSAAKIVVSGGRALGSAAEFKAVLEPLADRLGAAIGASRAAVDSGYAANDCQVGQTGKIVAPDLYIAIGISGAIQHLAGMKDSKIIVAINQDADAPIFSVADYGVVSDYKTAVPELMAALG